MLLAGGVQKCTLSRLPLYCWHCIAVCLLVVQTQYFTLKLFLKVQNVRFCILKLFWKFYSQFLQGNEINRRMVSSVERAPVCRAGGRGLKPRPDQHSIRYSHFAVSTTLGTKRTVSEEGLPHGQLLKASLTRRFCPLGDEVHYNPFTSINRPPATVSMNALLSSLRFSFHMQSFADVLFSLQPPQLCLLSLVYN